MNRTPTILSAIALVGVALLFVLHFTQKPCSNPSVHTPAQAGDGLRIAYVDIDSFEANYDRLKAKKEEFKQQQEAMENELARSAQQMQNDYTELQRKAQAGTLSQAEGEAAQKRLGQMQQSLETRRQSMSAQFQDKLESFNKDLHTRLDNFLTDYTKTHSFDYVLSYSAGNPIILYADKSLNITEDVIKGMNALGDKGATQDTTKSK
ncbi:MAG: OmpH family outer membrane protein [Bacteroidetes bacterium]|nr:OmpH family outer membrane protein [Bacteroidota bacterium]